MSPSSKRVNPMDTAVIKDSADARKTFRFTVNGIEYKSSDKEIDTREILNISNHRPADEHQLIRIADRRTFALDLERKTDLSEKGDEAFRAFHSDRAFRFTVDGRGFDWGINAIEEAELRTICEIGPDEVFKLEHEDMPDEIVDDGTKIDFAEKGTERLRIVRRPDVTVTVNTKPVVLARGWHKGRDIKVAAIAQGVNIKLDFVLDMEPVAGGDPKAIGDNDPIFIRGGEVFAAVDHHEDS
ncbi:hypothetical protein B5K08_05440 [Rhizobium leguminosarum bv. trifolii]|uniref:Multi-ubiquitin domain-containing protein n=2 Tax=Rhizobium leguminosarum TaxID=384 RepID=A0A3E1BXQ2_RHILT|nr:multiubiquitin domain-containing protein [Rhizobium leguminosarum]RFB97993.1 hypothetical protein B5K08_05440 [Rhizobium leguminosarum bv. trifolii]RFB99946.1 hypothetical protein B5K10_05430 [Rhizobium leguminosarum bv. trifolii]